MINDKLSIFLKQLKHKKISRKVHINTHTGNKPYHCKFCDSKFTTPGEVVRNVQYRHTLERPHKCIKRDYGSVELSKLKRRICCHTDEGPYQCTYASPETDKMKRHLRIHTGKNHMNRHMDSHMLIHTDEKPFKFDKCDKKLLNRHENVYYNKDYVAPEGKTKDPEMPSLSEILCPQRQPYQAHVNP
uniref:C2H2-type domain-containing protein n=1 Tax=Megaselia scalaris TaxID=36166 RepID=T1GEY9_MEGSC